MIWLSTIFWCQQLRSRTLKMTQYIYTAFSPVHIFPKNTDLSAPMFSTLPKCDRTIHFLATRFPVNKKRRRTQYIRVATHYSSFPAILACPSHVKTPACTQFLVQQISSQVVAGCIVINILTYLFHIAWGTVLLEMYCMHLIAACNKKITTCMSGHLGPTSLVQVSILRRMGLSKLPTRTPHSKKPLTQAIIEEGKHKLAQAVKTTTLPSARSALAHHAVPRFTLCRCELQLSLWNLLVASDLCFPGR